jgi:hypothetical protein
VQNGYEDAWEQRKAKLKPLYMKAFKMLKGWR